MDRAKLDGLLMRLKSYVQVLEGISAVAKEDFLRDPDKIGNAKYHFVIAIECCIDVAKPIIASRKLRIPRDNADAFAVLVESGLCPGGKTSFMAMATSRYQLVHRSWEVDDALVASYLEEKLDDFRKFAEAVSSLA